LTWISVNPIHQQIRDTCGAIEIMVNVCVM